MSASELYTALAGKISLSARQWWPDYGSFWVVIGAILGQNTKFENALKALNNLRNNGVDSLESLARIPTTKLAELIKPAGFYNTKAKRLNSLAKAICADFGDFESFKQNVSKQWLFSQKGLGSESVYSVLCFACERAYMVYDSYSARLLNELGYEFESYEEGREFLEGVLSETGAKDGAGEELSEALLCAHFHALPTEFCKAHLKGKIFDNEAKEFLKTLL